MNTLITTATVVPGWSLDPQVPKTLPWDQPSQNFFHNNLKFLLPFSLSLTHDSTLDFSRHYLMWFNQFTLNTEAGKRFQSYFKEDIKIRKTKQCHSSHENIFL